MMKGYTKNEPGKDVKFIDIVVFIGVSIGLLFIIMSIASCKHEPVIPEVDPNATGGGQGTGGGGGGGGQNGIVCDPDTVYFNQDILPLLVSNCAMPGCHDAATASDGVVLDSYGSVMATADVDPFNPSGSDLYEVLIETDPDKRMPPPPAQPLDPSLIAMIEKWIMQGAQNLNCDPNAGICDSVNVSFSLEVRPIIQNKCQGCHNMNNMSGGITLDSWQSVNAAAMSGSLVGAITHASGYTGMPYNSSMLPDCEIALIRNWVVEGALNN